MALLKTSSLITTISGKVGGSTFVNGAQGNYLKNNGNYKKSATLSQNAQRALSANVLQSYKNLTSAQKQTFINKANQFTYINRVGENKTYKPYQVFMLLNQVAVLYGAPLITNCPDAVIFPTMSVSLFNVLPNEISAQQSGMNPSDLIAIYATPPLSTGISNGRKFLKKIGFTTGSTFSFPTQLTLIWENVFGPMLSGQNIFFSFRQISSTSFQQTDFQQSQFITVL